jgi:uncharacterized membrane protein
VSKKYNLKQIGVFSLVLSLLFWSLIIFQGETTTKDLLPLEGEFNKSRKAQILSKRYGKSTVISLKNYPNIEFNLGENFEYDRLLKEIKMASNPIMIKINIQKKFYNESRVIVPAFYGFWINNKVIKSAEDGFESDKFDRGILITIGMILSVFGVGLLIMSRKKKIYNNMA